MMRRLTLAALLSSLPTAVTTQAQSDTSLLAGRPPSGAALTLPSVAEGHLAPICDGSEMRRLERRRNVGGALALGTLAGNFLVGTLSLALGSHNPEDAPRQIDRGRRAMTLAIASLPITFLGYHIYQSSYPDEAFWRRTLARMKIGETRSVDVRTCLRAPSATSSSGAEEKLTYFTSRPAGWWDGGPIRTVSFTFKDSVLTEVRRSEVRLPPAQAWPVTDPVPR
jgi:hypothetical protein